MSSRSCDSAGKPTLESDSARLHFRQSPLCVSTVGSATAVQNEAIGALVSLDAHAPASTPSAKSRRASPRARCAISWPSIITIASGHSMTSKIAITASPAYQPRRGCGSSGAAREGCREVRRPVRGGSAGTSPAAVGYSAALGWARRAGRRRGGLGAVRTRTRHATAGCWSSTADAARLRASSTNCRGTGWLGRNIRVEWCSRIALSRSIMEVLLQRGLDQPCPLHIHVGLQHRPA